MSPTVMMSDVPIEVLWHLDPLEAGERELVRIDPIEDLLEDAAFDFLLRHTVRLLPSILLRTVWHERLQREL